MLELPQLLLDELEGGGVVVAPSRQRAAAIRLSYAASKLRQGAKLWQTPDVVALRPWLEREALRRVDLDGERALQGTEEWLLWRHIVSDLMRGADALPTDSLVEALQRSARLMFDWRIPADALERLGDAESVLLAQALAAVDEQSANLNAVPSYRLIERLQSVIPRRSMVFAGFMERTAARAAIVERWIEKGVSVREGRAEGPIGPSRVVRAQDANDEIGSAAAWCREQLHADPSRRLLVIVPDLDQRRYAVTQAFEQALTPQLTLRRGNRDESEELFAVEGGRPLSTYPLVHHALTSLRFFCRSLDFARWSEWIRSAFWRSPSVVERARLEAVLRGSLDIEVTVQQLAAALLAAPSHLSAMAEEIRGALTLAANTLEAGVADERAWVWSRRFGATLQALGWPGSRALTSGEQQTLARFQELLGELAALSANLSPMRAGDALKILEDLAARASFEPATGDPAVTLSASLSDPVVTYDGIWITGLHGDAWPQPVSIDPFIPLALQRKAGIPSVSPGHRLEQARSLLNIWRRTARELVVSWPQQDGDREYLASPLLDVLQVSAPGGARADAIAGKNTSAAAIKNTADVRADTRPRRGKRTSEAARLQLSLFIDESAPHTVTEPARATAVVPHASVERSKAAIAMPLESVESGGAADIVSLAHLIRAARRVESYDDAVGEPWPVAKLVPAGVRTLEFQNRCPVLAYASFRLGAAPLETPQPGVDYRDRGMLVHSALEILWKRLGDSQHLHEANGARLDAMIDESVTQAMADAFAVGGVYQEQRSISREHRRTSRLIRRLCDAELQRPPFRVSELEAERRWTSAAGTAMRLRIDRIDQLEDGTYAIFDYKSGAAQTQDWTSERVSHPQLLVYMLASGVNVSTLAMAQITPLRVGFKGIADRKGRLPRVPSLEGDEGSASQRWQEQTVRWREAIERLAADFVAGAAPLDPMANACRICHLHAFCRIADAPGEDDTAGESLP